MKLKYIVFDETNLTVCRDKKDNIMLFNTANKALKFAQLNIKGWRLIEMPVNLTSYFR